MKRLKAVLFIAVITANLASLWMVIEFIIYLVKDHPFNWWSVVLFVVIAAILSVCWIIIVGYEQNNLTKTK